MLLNYGLVKILESPLDCTGIKPVNPKENQCWIFIGRTDAEAEALILWPPDAKNWLIWKDPDAGKDWRQEKKGMTKDEMVGWHPWLDGHEFEQALVVDDGQGSLVCCSPWGHKESDTTSDWTELDYDILSKTVPCPFPSCYRLIHHRKMSIWSKIWNIKLILSANFSSKICYVLGTKNETVNKTNSLCPHS